MALRLDRIIDGLVDTLLDGDLFKAVADILGDLDLSSINLGKFFGGLNLDNLVDDLLDGLDSIIDIFSNDFNLFKFVGDVDDLVGGVDLSKLNFDELLKDVLGDVSVNQLLKDLDRLIGPVEVDDLFETGSDLGKLAGRVQSIVNDIFDDFSTGVDQLLAGNSKGNLLKGLRTSDILSGNGGGDRLLGLGGADILLGGSGPDALLGGAGADILFGGLGRVLLTGGRGADIFALAKGKDFATVTDFRSGIDALTVLGNISFEDLKLSQRGGDAVLSYGSDVLAVLKGVDINNLSIQDFV